MCENEEKDEGKRGRGGRRMRERDERAYNGGNEKITTRSG